MDSYIDIVRNAFDYLDREIVTNLLINAVRGKPPSEPVDGARYNFLWKALQTPAGKDIVSIASQLALGSRPTEDSTVDIGIAEEKLNDVEQMLGSLTQGAAAALKTKLRVLKKDLEEARRVGDESRLDHTCEEAAALLEEAKILAKKAKKKKSGSPKKSSEPYKVEQDSFALHWLAFVKSQSPDPAFLHGVALMHWEWARELEDEDFALATHHFKWAKYYWIHLLGRQGYWQTFSQTYHPDHEDVSEKLHQEVRQEILQYHLERCRLNFNQWRTSSDQDRLEAARLHLSCLCRWNVSNTSKPLGMTDAPLLDQPWEKSALETVDVDAQRLLEGWVSTWLKEADEALSNPDVELPRGISKNFDGALNGLRPCLELVPVHPAGFLRILKVMIRHANSWAFEAAVSGERDKANEIMRSISPVIDHLKAQLVKPAANTIASPDQKTLSNTFLVLAQLSEDPEQSVLYAEEAGVWDPGNRSAGDILTQVQARVKIDQAQEHLESQQFAEALAVLSEVNLQAVPAARDAVRQLQAGAYFQWAIQDSHEANRKTSAMIDAVAARKNIGRLDSAPELQAIIQGLQQACEHMRMALELEPSESVFIANLQQLETELRERPFVLKVAVGDRLLSADRYSEAITLLEEIPARAGEVYGQAQQLRASGYFHRSIEHAKNQHFDDAVRDMRRARDIVPDNDVVRQQLAELEAVQQNAPFIRAVNDAQSLMQQEAFQRALDRLNTVPTSFPQYQDVQKLKAICEFQLGIEAANSGDLDGAETHLRRAQRLDPTEPHIAEQLAALNEARQVAPIVNAIHEAQSLMQQKSFQRALDKLNTVPRSFPQYGDVQKLKAICEFQIGIEAANRGDLNGAVSHLESATRLDPSESTIREQLDVARKMLRHKPGYDKAQGVMAELSRHGPRNPITPSDAYDMLRRLNEAVIETEYDPNVVQLRDQLQDAMNR